MKTIILVFAGWCFGLDGAAILNNMAPGTWFEVPNSKIRSVAPANGHNGWGYDFNFHSKSVVTAWCGGAYDTKRNRMIIWGGGHGDYSGNELYGFDVNTMSWERLTEPSKPNYYPGNPSGSSCIDVLPDGKPNARHTYDGLAYIEHADRFFGNGGSMACGTGSGGNKTWTFDFDNDTWTNMNPSGSQPRAVNLSNTSAYDPVSKLVYFSDRTNFLSYDFTKNIWTRLGDGAMPLDYNSAIDHKRGVMLSVGPKGGYYWEIGKKDYGRKTLSSSGDNGLLSTQAPGMAYDPIADKFVGYVNRTIYEFDWDQKKWSSSSPSGAPTRSGPANTGKVYSHWQYIPAFNAFIIVTHVDDNVFFYKHTAGAGTSGETKNLSSKVSGRFFTAAPNPFRGSTVFSVPGKKVHLTIFDLSGKIIREINSSTGGKAVWTPKNAAPGVYMARAAVDGKTFQRKIVLER